MIFLVVTVLFFVLIESIIASNSFVWYAPTSTMSANITFNQTPLINQNVDLTVELLSVINATNTTANITLPSEVELISGETQWNVSLLENVTSNHTITIKINATGNFSIETRARDPPNGSTYMGARKIIYLEVTDNNTVIDDFAPLKPLWNYTKLGVNITNDPADSTSNFTVIPNATSLNASSLRQLVYYPFNDTQEGQNGTDGTVIVIGRILFDRRSGGSASARYVTVYVYDENIGPDELLWTGITDVNGRFITDPINNNDPQGGTRDIYVRVIARSSVGTIQNFFNFWYDWFTRTFPNVPNGTFNIGTWINPPSEPEPWWIYDDILSGWLFVANNANPSRSINDVVVEWPRSHTDYHIGGREIHLSDGHANDRDVVLHEYGHHVMNDIYVNFPSTTNCNPHFINRRSSDSCAWVEGWANYAPLFVDDDPLFIDTTQNFRINFENDPNFIFWDEGDEVEGRVTASLWDFSDDASEDDFNGNFNDDVWYTFDRQDDSKFIDYWSAWTNDHTILERYDALAATAQNTIYYATTEVKCDNGIDEDGDGFTDCADGDCTQGSTSQTGFCCGSGCSTNGGTCQDASTSGFTCTDGNCNTYGEACQNSQLESNLLCSGTQLSCSGGDCEKNFGAPTSCDEITPGDEACENSNGLSDERACEVSVINHCYLEAEYICGAPGPQNQGCDEKIEDECSNNNGFQCEWHGTYSDNVVEECESTGCGAISQCDERDPGYEYARCDTGEETFFADECSNSCGGQDRGDNICRSANSLGAGDGCTADPACNNAVAGTGECSATCTFLGGDNPPITTLVSPPDNSVDEDGSVTFNCSATDDNNLVNMTLYGDWSGGWHANETKGLSGTSDSATFTKALTDGIYVWNCLAYDNSSQSDWADVNWTINISIVNAAPTTPTYLSCDGSICTNNGTFFDNIAINCSGSTDAENDSITYFTDSFYIDNSLTSINNFNNSLQTENLTFSGDENITRYLEIPKSANVISGSLNLSSTSGGDPVFSGVAAYYKLDETSGTTAKDAHGSNDGTASNARIFAAQTGGIIGNGANFSQGDDFINITYPDIRSALDHTTPFTVAFWFNTTSETNFNSLFALDNGSSGGNQLNIYYDTNKFHAVIGGTGGLDSSGGLLDGGWHHMVVVRNETNGILYINGTEVGRNIPGSNTYAGDIYIARRDHPSGNYFNGLIDEVGIWNRSLTHQEVIDLYNNGNGKPFSTSSNITNPYLEVGTPDGAYEWNYTGEFNQANVKTDDLSSAINSALNNEACDCTGCSLNGDNCKIPFLFHSDTAGTLEYNHIDINYQTTSPTWRNIGNHSESSVLNWDIINITEQSGVDLRCRAIDLEGSNTYSSYYDPSINITISSSPIDLAELKVIYTNITERVFRFVINNTLASAIANISWSLDTGESNESSQYNISLTSGEDAFIFVYHNYTASGNYTVIASATNGTYTDTEEIMITV